LRSEEKSILGDLRLDPSVFDFGGQIRVDGSLDYPADVVIIFVQVVSDRERAVKEAVKPVIVNIEEAEALGGEKRRIGNEVVCRDPGQVKLVHDPSVNGHPVTVIRLGGIEFVVDILP